MPTELERENLHNLDVGDDYHLQGDAKWENRQGYAVSKGVRAVNSSSVPIWVSSRCSCEEEAPIGEADAEGTGEGDAR